jgi:hypothetical protein
MTSFGRPPRSTFRRPRRGSGKCWIVTCPRRTARADAPRRQWLPGAPRRCRCRARKARLLARQRARDRLGSPACPLLKTPERAAGSASDAPARTQPGKSAAPPKTPRQPSRRLPRRKPHDARGPLARAVVGTTLRRETVSFGTITDTRTASASARGVPKATDGLVVVALPHGAVARGSRSSANLDRSSGRRAEAVSRKRRPRTLRNTW